MAENNMPLFRDFNADENTEITEIQSLCTNCYDEGGTTKLLLTKIPHYKEVIIMSFACEKCGYGNCDIQPGGAIAEKGIRFRLNVTEPSDLNRQVVKSDYSKINILELDFEIPANSQKGNITTVEGILARSIMGLQQDQAKRKIEYPEVAKQIDRVIEKLEKLKALETPFTLILDDVSGNGHIENPNAPERDPRCIIQSYIRTSEQNQKLGIFSKDEISSEQGILQTISKDEFHLENFEREVMQFSANCNACCAPCQTNMKLTKIPHFKEVIIMATVCETCGYKTNEVKSGGGIEPHGIRIEVEVKSKEDFSRDVLKSDTCSLAIPQLDLEVGAWTLSGRFTTIEGILVAVKDQLSDRGFSHWVGDSQDSEKKNQLEKFLEKFNEVLEGKKIVSVILDDPAGNSYIQSLKDDGLDDALSIVHYDRNFEQNEDLGINDMKVDNYENS